MRTIQACGYEVTGEEEIIAEIEEKLKVPGKHIAWNKLYEEDVFFGKNGRVTYSASINHDKKTVLLTYKYSDEDFKHTNEDEDDN